MKNSILLLSFIFLLACSKQEDPVNAFFNCEHIAKYYKVYEGEDVSCAAHFLLTEYKDQQFIQLVDHCAGLGRDYIYDENCIDICVDVVDPDSDCVQVLRFGKTKGILLVRK